jgi:aryl carrier-like protein
LESTLEVILRDPNGVVMKINEAEHAPATVSTQSAENTNTSLDEPATTAIDTALRATILTTIAAVARCDVDSLSGATNIYSLGLDSISVIKVTGLLRKRHISLPVSKIVAAITLDRIVEEARRIDYPKHSAVSRAPMTSSASTLSESLRAYISAQDIAENAIEAILPASAGQIFMLDYYHATGRRLFYPTFRYRISSGKISQDQIIHAWDVVMRAYPALRTRFIENDGEIWQFVVKPDAIERYSPAAHLTVSREQGVVGLVVELQLHHALYDAVSLRIVISAFGKLCQGKLIQLETATNARSIRGFIDATRGDAAKTTSREFWTDYLTQLQTYSKSIDGHGSGTFTARRVEYFQENAVPNIKNRGLIARAAGAGVSLQALFLAAVGKIYASLTSQPDTVVLGVYLANRGLDINGLELETLAVPTMNVVPLVVDVKGDLMQSARGVQRDLAVIQRIENCGVTLREVYAWTGVRLNWLVNFLPTAGDDEEHEDRTRDNDGDMYDHGNGDIREEVKLVPYPYERRDKDTGNVGKRLMSPLLTSQTDLDRQMPWCVPGVDVEAKLEAGGGLTIGVFAPEDMLDQEGVWWVLGEIREVLENDGEVE